MRPSLDEQLQHHGFIHTQPAVLYDTVTIPAHSHFAHMSLFSQPVGDNKGLDQTNLTVSQQLPAPDSFIVQSIRFTFTLDTPAEAALSLSESMCWKLFLDNRWWAEGMHQRQDDVCYVKGSDRIHPHIVSIEEWRRWARTAEIVRGRRPKNT